MTTAEVLRDLFREIEHGDEEHRKWLKNKIEDYIQENELEKKHPLEENFVNTILSNMQLNKAYYMRQITNAVKLFESTYIEDSSKFDLVELERLAWTIEKLLDVNKLYVSKEKYSVDDFKGI